MLSEIQSLLMDQVNGEHLMKYTKEISREVRLSGSPEELRSFYYVQGLLDSFGLKTTLEFHDAYISLPIQATLSINGNSLPCITHSMALSTEGNILESTAVYIDEECLVLDQSVKNKIVILDGIATPNIVKEAQKKEAIAAIFINGPYTHEMIVSTVWGNPTSKTKEDLPKIPVVSIDNKSGELLKNIIAEHHDSKVRLSTVVESGWRKIPALIANIQGQKETEDFVLFSGHIDSWHYGAMDNASANATMIEVARILSINTQYLRRGVRFAFWSGHSHGRYAGSTSYCDHNWQELYDHCGLHIYIDSVGGKGATILSEANCMAETTQLGAKFIEIETKEKYMGKRFARAGDQSFWGTGIPSLFMGLSEQPLSNDPASKTLVKLFGGKRAGGFGWWWHTTEDTIDKIYKNFLIRDCKIYLATLFHTCSSRILPIDQLAAIKEIKSSLIKYQGLSKKRIEMDKLVNQINNIEKLSAEFYDQLVEDHLSDEELLTINKGLMKISRYLVPLNYVEGDIFEHDPAIGQVPIPMLSEILTLIDIKSGCDIEYEIKTSLLRKINKISYSLKGVEDNLTKLLSKLSI
ncbi:M28 family metallopeptidase [Litchfieldia alkalitelluris]|uniref:M28 family metallopeptidase n=1 Tax=Litchfieldia alkalitelluris TaxID=304268 RepID=UPI0009973973|nr:M28 family metallopeptidase [Litchfieldia alkalitelluris]